MQFHYDPTTGDRLTWYESHAEYIRDVITPMLGDYTADYDLDGIAAAMLTHTVIETRTIDGQITPTLTGYTERTDLDLASILDQHDRSTQ